MQALRDSGWTIEVDPKAGLTSHDATEFFPVIEADPDHGIDWFRFDITFELQGKQVSLIPIIAQAIRMDLPAADSPDLPEFLSVPCENPEDGFIRFPARRLIEMVDQVRHLFHGNTGDGPIRIDRIAAAGVADGLAIDSSETTRALAKLGHNLRNITATAAGGVARLDFAPNCVPISLKASAGSSFSPTTGSTASSPTTWASEKPSRPSPTSPPSARSPRPALARHRPHLRRA